jgi:hypothetical protein
MTSEADDAVTRSVRIGRPNLGQPRRVRVTTTIEPSKLASLRRHALRTKKSLGQLADEYVSYHFPEAEPLDD